MDNYPLVSVIIPTCKRKWNYLSRAVNSVLNQTYPNFEIIVIDDSPDSFVDRQVIIDNMKNLMTSESRVKYHVNEKNMGGSLSRNKGIDLSSGDYITFLDDDDEYLPLKIEHQIDYMLKNECDLCFENVNIYNSKGNIIDVREYKDLKLFDNDSLLHYHLTKQITATCTFMFTSSKLKQIGGFDDAVMGQEFYLMMKSILSGLIIRYNPICDVMMYHHEGERISTGKNKIKGEKIEYNYKKQFFSKLSLREKMFIRFRHFAVIAVTHLRNKRYIKSVFYGFVAVLSSPVDSISQLFLFLKRIIKTNKIHNT